MRKLNERSVERITIQYNEDERSEYRFFDFVINFLIQGQGCKGEVFGEPEQGI
ncbi:MAG TPA: hypothetical protein VIO64_05610 [Pseudobacteroides sp.]|uniref:hypothetical protein n=1 Tax=Pseudobacteroides sp. TaxID=1968840 RepID=UPI002F926543